MATISRFLPSEKEDEKNMECAQTEANVRDVIGTNSQSPPHKSHHRITSALPHNDFIKQLTREKRRAERSGRPLSIVVYRVTENNNTSANASDVGDLLETLHKVSRETDIIGHYGTDLIAVLCPDTDEQGISAYEKKVSGLAGHRWNAIEIATYPDQLFESLADTGRLSSTLEKLVSSDFEGRSPHGYGLKRWLDVVGAIVLLIIFSPIMLLVALLVATTSSGPIIFKQMRLGTGGVPFAFYKFRSMVVNMDDSIHRNFVSDLIKGGLESTNQQGNSSTAPVYKIRSDPRVTWIGRIIRKTSIDELPQLFNVLKGDMSLVGPRPPIPYEAEIYQAWHLRRVLTAKPGITGLWQVQARSTVTFNEMVRLDLRYIRECSLALDLKILLKTVKVVIRCDGAV
jgi:lipopolysaccharide/colanic/teichoic acid biosynthesis glycosyltransferase